MNILHFRLNLYDNYMKTLPASQVPQPECRSNPRVPRRPPGLESGDVPTATRRQSTRRHGAGHIRARAKGTGATGADRGAKRRKTLTKDRDVANRRTTRGSLWSGSDGCSDRSGNRAGKTAGWHQADAGPPQEQRRRHPLGPARSAVRAPPNRPENGRGLGSGLSGFPAPIAAGPTRCRGGAGRDGASPERGRVRDDNRAAPCRRWSAG